MNQYWRHGGADTRGACSASCSSTRDTAQHRQRHPPGGQHGLRVAPDRTARLRWKTACCSAPGLTITSTHAHAGMPVGRPFSPARRRRWIGSSPSPPRVANCWGDALVRRRLAGVWQRTAGLPAELRDSFPPAQRVRLPMREGQRSLNLQCRRGRGIRRLAAERLRRRRLKPLGLGARVAPHQLFHRCPRRKPSVQQGHHGSRDGHLNPSAFARASTVGAL